MAALLFLLIGRREGYDSLTLYRSAAGAPSLRGFRKGGIRKCLGCPILTVDLRAGRDNEQTTGSMRKELS